jgi:hypothetical protein
MSIWSEIGIGVGIWLFFLILIMGILWRSYKSSNSILASHDDSGRQPDVWPDSVNW